MASTRLPGKVLRPMAGVPMLLRVLRRLQAADGFTGQPVDVVVATSREPGDDAVEAFCAGAGLRCVRGSHGNVMQRYLDAIDGLPDSATFLRATADNCFYCPQRTAAIIDHHLASSADYTSLEDLSYVVPEVVNAGAFRRMVAAADDPYCREHVTPYFRTAPGREQFAVTRLPPVWQGLRPELRLTVDTADEFERAEAICLALAGGGDDLLFPLDAIYAYCDSAGGAS